MARYKVTWTIYKDPKGKTLMGPTFVHAIGDICSAVGLMGILYVILALMDGYGAPAMIIGVVVAVAGFGLCVLLHKKAKAGAEAAFLKVLEQEERERATVQKKD